ncbi:MAG: DUF3368 domain-containing protein [Gammaproteobacteria bacterium]|nr:DUF3368 domain-containing protein [Gammaproteobacteria bacterium]
MKVFCNTTPFIALSATGLLELLPKLFGEVYAVDAVVAECAHGGKIPVPDLTALEWVRIVKSEPCDSLILLELDKGEKHTLDMARRMAADWVIIDEKLGRNLGEYLGLNITGTLGVLLKAKQQGLIASFSDYARQMQIQGIRYNTGLLRRLAEQTGEIF